MRVLVTGSDGQIGKRVVDMLDGHEVLKVDKKSGRDLNDPKTQNLIRDFDPEAVFHLAASFERLLETREFDKVNWEDNVLATNNLLGCLGEVKQFIFASSYLVYQRPSYTSGVNKIALPIYEEFPLGPRNLCGYSKLYCEGAINFAFPGKATHARIFRVYSPESKCFINHFATIKKLGGTVNVWNTGGTFDLIHAKDVASSLVTLFDKKATGVFNVGTGTPHTVADVIKLTGVSTNLAEDMDYTEKCYASVGKLRSVTGWKPAITLEQGVEEIIHGS